MPEISCNMENLIKSDGKESLIGTSADRPLLAFWTVQLDTWPSSLGRAPESGPKWTVQKGESGQFMSFEPSSFSHLDHLLLLRTSRFICLDGTVFLLWTVHFRRPSTLSLLDRQVWSMTVQFQSFGPSSLTPPPGTDHFDPRPSSLDLTSYPYCTLTQKQHKLWTITLMRIIFMFPNALFPIYNFMFPI